MSTPQPPGKDRPVAALIPVKGFADAKRRLAGHLTNGQRASLARHMAERVVGAAGRLPVFVVCDDPDVRDWAPTVGAEALWSPGRGLNGAVTRGVASLAASGFGRVVVAHADLPLAADLTWVAGPDDLATDGSAGDGLGQVTVVPDRHGDGTNVIAVPADVGFCFQYGPASSTRHVAEAVRLRLSVRVQRDPALGWDVDVPGDLRVPRDLAAGRELGPMFELVAPVEQTCP